MSQESLLGPYLKPGTPIKVGGYSTKIIRYLSEGGFSHVYTARLDIPVKGSDIAVLKRIVAPDKHALAAIRTEVETMKKLKGHRYIVTYIDSHASALKTGGFEVYVLMEYCPGGGLIDFMNTRLQTRLAEWEVLKIISDTTEAVACMHYLRPPLLHRDLKIENVLISGNGDYKLCDFGSCTEPRSAAATSQERRALEDDIQKNTTIQYRSPEMVDVGRRLPIDEKSDIWALGVLLYKLCYFTTPFEAQGQLAILNAAYTFPPYPPYTDRTKRLIAVTLQENPRDRPNIYQLLAELCAMRNLPVPIPDIYSKKRDQSVGKSSRSSSRPPSAPNNEDILTYEAAAAAAPKTPIIPTADVVPMRRGRPERTTSPTRLDLKSQTHHRSSSRPNTAGEGIVGDVAEFTTKFPSLEEMDQSLQSTSIPRDQGIGKRRPDELESSGPPAQALSPADLGLSHPGRATGSGARPLPQTPDLQTNSSADVADRPIRGLAVDDPSSGLEGAQARIAQGPRSEAYVLRNTDYQANNDSRIPPTGPAPAVRPKPVFPDVGRPIQPNQNASNPYTTSKPDNLFAERLQARPQMVSRASQTSPKPKQAVQTQTSPPKRTNANHNFSTDSSLSSNLTRDSSGLVIPKAAFSKGQANASGVTQQMQFKFSTTLDRPNQRMKAQQEIERSKSATGGRPKTIHVDSSMDFLRDIDSPMTSVTHSDSLEASRTGSSQVSDSSRRQINSAPRTTNAEPRLPPITSDLRRSVSVSASNRRHHKRPSISTIPSFSGAAKNIMNGKFGDAFKKFEVSGKPRGTTSAIERSNPLQVAENDLPEHITQHLQSAEARRSSSYSRARPSMESQVIDNESYRNHTEQSVNIESSSTSVKEAMRRLKEKATQSYVPSQRTAQGYGKYTEPEGLHRAATVIPYARTTGTERPVANSKSAPKWVGRNPGRYGLQEDDEESSFSNRYPALNDDFKV